MDAKDNIPNININQILIIFICIISTSILFLLAVIIVTLNTNYTQSRNREKQISNSTKTFSYPQSQKTTISTSATEAKGSSLSSSATISTITSSNTSINISDIDPNTSLDIPILMFHHIDIGDYSVSDPIRAGLTVSPEMFEKDLQYLQNSGYTTIWPEEIFTKLANNDKGKYVVITLDDGYMDNYTYALPLLKKYNMKAIIYIITDMVGGTNGNNYLTWDNIKEMENVGLIKFGSHSLTHPNLANMDEAGQHKQLLESKKALDEKLGYEVKDFCYPSGKYNDTTIKLLKEIGYTNATTVKYGQDRTVKNSFEWSRFRVWDDHVIRL